LNWNLRGAYFTQMYSMHVRKVTTRAGSLEFTEDTAEKIAIDFFF
jgi:hypothetical protein